MPYDFFLYARIRSDAEPLNTEANDPCQNVIKLRSGDVTISNLPITGGKDGINAKGMISLTLKDVVVTENAGDGLDAENVRWE